jgi:adenosylmethionine-8-amino-7-oxononanoate aminotransferase
MSSVLHRALNATLPTVVGGEGNYLIDHEGKRYLDACGGAAVSCLGHDNERIRTALKAQIDRIAFAHTSFFTNEPAELLARFLVARFLAPVHNADETRHRASPFFEARVRL